MSLLVVPVTDVAPTTPRAAIVRLGVSGVELTFAPGQALMLGRHGQPVRKPYSIASAPDDVRRGGVVEFLVGTAEDRRFDSHLAGLAVGTPVDLEGPLGSFSLPADSSLSRFVFVAGGTGIAPLRSMWRHLVHTRPGARLDVVYSARTRAHFAYRDELAELKAAGRLTLTLTTTREPAPGGEEGRSTEAAGSRHRSGRIGREHLEDLVAQGPAVWLVCGPPAFVPHIEGLLDELGVPRDSIRKEGW
jgi:ferredoxin-NADP reductase